MRKKEKSGFTLIELLAVIVILAVIAVIVTPMITGIISEVKLSADMRTAEAYVSAAQNYYAGSLISVEKQNNIGLNIIDKLEISSKPATGNIITYEDGAVAMAIIINNRCYKKSRQIADINMTENSDDCNIYNVPPARCFDTTDNADGTIMISKYKCGNTVASVDFGPYVASFDTTGEYIDIELPMALNGKKVTKIGGYSFMGYNAGDKVGVNSISIPSGYTSIEFSAFALNQITKINFSNTLTEIKNNAFKSNKLTSVIIPNSVVALGSESFSENNLTNIDIPNSVVTVGDTVINDNKLPDDQAFFYARSDTNNNGVIEENEIDKKKIISYGGVKKENVVVPDGVETINSFSFSRMGLVSIELPSTITSLPSKTFGNCDDLITIKINKPTGSITGSPWGASSSPTITWVD